MSETFDLEPDFLRLYERCRAETMTSIERMYALYQAVRYAVDREVPGDFVECGVWRGGSVMLMALALLELGRSDRTIWLFDTFTGMTPPSPEDVQEMSGRAASAILAERERSADDPFWGIAPRARVEENLRATGYPMSRFRVVEGDVLTTIPAEGLAGVALLRLDTDWYATTRHEMDQLYPRLAPEGVLIVDDYGYWRGARKAVDEYFAAHPPRPLLTRIDYTGRIAVK